MPLTHLWSVVKASSHNHPHDDQTSALDCSGDRSNSQSIGDASRVSDDSPNAVTSPADVASLSSQPETIVSRHAEDTLHNLGATASFLSEKVKRLFRINFGGGDPSPEEAATADDDSSELIKTPSATELETPVPKGPYDETLDSDLYQFILEEARRRQEDETPRERLRAAVTRNPMTGVFPTELRIFYDFTCTAFAVGLFVGWKKGQKAARTKFLQLNLATKYTSPMGANRKRTDYLFFTGVKNGFNYALPLTGFMMVTSGVAIALDVVDGEEKWWHWVTGAAFAGFNNRIMLGPRACLIGGLVGGVMGVIFAVPAFWLKRYAGVATLKEINYHRHVQDVMHHMYDKQMLPAPPKQFELYNADPYGGQHK